MSFDFQGGTQSLVKMYKKSPQVFMDFISAYESDISFSNQEWLALYEGARKKDKEQLFDLLTSRMEKMLSDSENKTYGMGDSNIIFTDAIIDKFPKSVQKKFGDMLIKSFSCAYSKSDRQWSHTYKYGSRYGDQKYFTKTTYKKMVKKHLAAGRVDPLKLIQYSADVIAPPILREFVGFVPQGLKNEKLKAVLRDTDKYSCLGYSAKDLQNSSRRRGLLRKIVRNSDLAKRLVEPVEFKVSDIRAISPEDRWAFFSAYYRFSHWKKQIKPGGYGRRVKFERNLTMDEAESLLFPLVIKKHENVGSFLTHYAEYIK